MESPVSYIPIDRHLAMARGESLPDRTEGAALFADISGFTPLTEALAEELGPKRGAEELTKQLDAVYGALIAEVHRYRGSVTGFAGDAITCWFDEDAGLRAAACALAMQQVMSNYHTVRTPAGGTVSLAIKVAIASGPVRRFLAGDPSIQYVDVLAGVTLDRMAAAEHHAGKGEVVVTPEVAERLAGDLRIGEWRHVGDAGERVATVTGLVAPVPPNPWPDPPPGSLSEGETRPWILPAMYERLMRGHDAYLAEIRSVVALFLRFEGIDYDGDPAAGEKLDTYVRRVQSVLERYGGSLLQLMTGDKGSVLYSAFGAPLAHDDDSARAASAGLELRALPPELGYIRSVQIGISRGRMRAGPYGSPIRRTYGLLGDAVNLAARLMSRAQPGEVLVDRRIAEAVSKSFDLGEPAPVMVKGKKEPVQVRALLGRKAQPARHEAVLSSRMLVGRESELERMSSVLGDSLSGRGQVLCLEGPNGIGKSHLAAELARQARERGMRIAQGACESTGAGGAYAAWRQIFRSLLDLPDEPAPGEDPSAALALQIEAVESYLGRTNPDWMLRLPLLGDLLGLPIADNSTTAEFDPRLRQSALFDLIADIVQARARDEPLFLLIDDVHWMDEASQGLTLALGRAIGDAPVMLVLLNRPPFPGQEILPGIDRLPIYGKLSLNELSPAGVAALVAGRLGGPAEPLALSLVVSLTQGNPFFVEEVIDSLKESGSLQPDGERWALSKGMVDALRRADAVVWVDGHRAIDPSKPLAGADAGLPDSVEEVVLSRIDRLPEAPKLTLKVASVIGLTFPLDLLAHAHPVRDTEAELASQVAVLEERDFTRLEVPPPRPIYIFKHNVTHDVAYGTLLYAQRLQLHRAVGEALEEFSPEATEQLAYHTFEGEDWARAARYQAMAGQQAQKLFANHEGIEHLKKALQAAGNLPPEETVAERQQIYLGLGTMLTYTGQYEPALEHLRSALDLAIAMGDRNAQAQACRWIAYLYEYRGELATALEWIEHGLEALGDDETAYTAELLAIAGLINTRQGNYDQAQEQCESSMRIAAGLGETTSLAFASNSRAIVSLMRGNNASAMEYHQKALDLYREADSVHGMAMSYNGIANVYFGRGRWPEAYKYYRQAREIFDQTGDVLHQVFADNNLGGIALNQGRLDDALDFYSSALKSLEQTGGSPYVIGVLHMNLGATFGRGARIEEAREHLATGQEYFARANSRDFLPETHRHLAEVALAAEEPTEAEDHARQAIALARELQMRGEEGSNLRVLGKAVAAQGDLRLAERHMADSLAILEEVEDEYELARSRLAMAGVWLAQGRHVEAESMLYLCVEVFERLEASLDLEATRDLLGRVGGGSMPLASYPFSPLLGESG